MIGMTLRTADIRNQFKELLAARAFTSVNREANLLGFTGATTIEIVGAAFIADEPSIFGEINHEYVKREEEWYNSMSLNVYDIPGGPPQIWKTVADPDGYINSNYGWCIYSSSNGFTHYDDVVNQLIDNDCQYNRALIELRQNPESRRAVMIYTRPSMWLDYNKNGRSDFMCTNAVQYMIRDGELHALVQMRSNDAVFGYKNDWAWQRHVQTKLAGDLDVPVGNLLWNAGSLHVYARHYSLVDPNYQA